MKISQIFGADVELKDKKKRGYVMGVTCIEDVISGYICCDESENEFFADGLGARFTNGKLRALTCGKKSKKHRPLLLGRALYSEDGKFLGHVDDFTVKADRIIYAHCGNRKYPYSNVVFGDVAVLKNQKPLAEIAAKDMFITAICND
ncbi:MAG: hypothetical protein K2K39_03665, partial [Clostridia bacterium]|nr:hypothetical protein [Clostridia bacterium]